MSLTQTGEKTALFCLAQHDWKLDIALDNYFANPELYYRETKVVSVDRKKLETLYNKYRGMCRSYNYVFVFYKVSKRPLCPISYKENFVSFQIIQSQTK